jgi:DNA-binding GntR family transcriptional regulator
MQMSSVSAHTPLPARTALADDIRRWLRDSIVNLDIKPGEQLNELLLAEKLGVSRSPLREAFRLLEAEGFVVRQSGKGVFVREVTAIDILELFPVRAALEGLAAELAASRLTDKELRALGNITDKMAQAAEQRDVKIYQRLNYDFHRNIVRGAHNRRLEEIINNLGRQAMWYFFATLMFKKYMDYVMDSHREIYLALEARDGKLAAQRISEHIIEGGKNILGLFPLTRGTI